MGCTHPAWDLTWQAESGATGGLGRAVQLCIWGLLRSPHGYINLFTVSPVQDWAGCRERGEGQKRVGGAGGANHRV